MRVLVFFDLPTLTANDRKEYARFRKFLIKEGFLMEQESVYSKLVVNGSAADALSANVKRNSPMKGIVQLMKVTENQYSKMEYLAGKRASEVYDGDERLIFL